MIFGICRGSADDHENEGNCCAEGAEAEGIPFIFQSGLSSGWGKYCCFDIPRPFNYGSDNSDRFSLSRECAFSYKTLPYAEALWGSNDMEV